jgi:hypothetical protein
MSSEDFANRFQITSPCQEDWDSMIGSNQIRFCTHCQSSVHDFSTMTRKQIKKLIARLQRAALRQVFERQPSSPDHSTRDR